MAMRHKGRRATGNPLLSASEYTREPEHSTPSHDRQSIPPPPSASLSWRVIGRERRRTAPPRIIKIHEFLACHVGMDGSRCVGTDFLNTPRLRREDEPIYPTDDLGMLPVESRPFQRRSASIHINEQLVHRPAHSLFPDYLRKMGLDHGIGHFMLFEVDSVARAPVPPILKSRQTASAASDRKTAPQPSSRQAG
jgi:hypothetical protein